MRLILAFLMGLPSIGAAQDLTLAEQVRRCWNISTVDLEAAVTVRVAFGLTATGQVMNRNVWLESSSSTDDTATQDAFGNARRAILRCEQGGYVLPAESLGRGLLIDMTFSPNGPQAGS